MATSLARTASSENHTAAISPRPSEIPYRAAGVSLRHAAHLAMSRAAGSASSWATAPSLSGPASRIRTRDAAVGELADQRADRGGSRVRGRERFGGLGQRVQVGRVDHQRPAGQRPRRPPDAGRVGLGDGPGVHPGEGRGPADAEQPGQHRLGDGVGTDADEYAFPGRPRRGGDGQQAGPGPFGRVDPAHAKGGELAAQPRVGLVQVPRQDQRYRHACPPSGTGRRDSRLALQNVAGGHARGREEHAGQHVSASRCRHPVPAHTRPGPGETAPVQLDCTASPLNCTASRPQPGVPVGTKPRSVTDTGGHPA